MKKKKLLSLLAIMTLLGSIGNKVDSATKVNATDISGDLYGSARIEGLIQELLRKLTQICKAILIFLELVYI